MRCLGIVSLMATCFVALYMHLTYRHEYAPVLEVCASRFRPLLLEIMLSLEAHRNRSV
jgi:hypothetical protein